MSGKSKETTTYIRINGTSRPADKRKLKELELEGQHISYDSLQDIGKEFNEEKAKMLCKKMKQVALDACRTDEERDAVKDLTFEKLEDFGLLCRVGKDFYPTHAFDLFTDNKNKSAKIQCALFKGKERDIFIDKKEFDGPIYEQVEDAYQFVLRHINAGAEIGGIFRHDAYELPPSAIREMIANAVVHRSYLDNSCIQVCVFDDRIEVLSPGMLYDGLDLETAKKGKSRCRNEAVAEAFHYMRIVEAWGTGIPRIINRCKEYGLSQPLFEEMGDGFKVTLYRRLSKVSNASKKVSNAPEKVSNAPEKVSNAPEKVSNASEKVSNAPEKVSNASEKVSNTPKKVSNAFDKYLNLLDEAGTTATFVTNIEKVFAVCGTDKIFGQSDIMNWLECSKSKATNVIKVMKAAGIIEKVAGSGAGKYKFI